jgi:hypothetical protein
MDGERLYAVVSMPAGLHEALGDAQVRRLASANPRAEVALVGDPARFAEPLPRADAALVWPTMAPLLAPAPARGAGCAGSTTSRPASRAR